MNYINLVNEINKKIIKNKNKIIKNLNENIKGLKIIKNNLLENQIDENDSFNLDLIENNIKDLRNYL